MIPARGRHNHLMRRLTESALEALMLRGRFAAGCHRLGLQGRFGVVRHDVELKRGPSLPRPLTLAFASDFHAGPSTHHGVFEELLAALSQIRPDVLLLGGDFVSGHASHARAFAAGLAAQDPPLGKFAVLGNHDLWTEEVELGRLLRGAGIELLVNAGRRLPPPFESVSICGIDDPWTGTVDARRAFAGADGVRIFLTHSPDGLVLLDGEGFHLAFAGHTHGGQVALPGGTPLILPKGPLCRPYAYGRFEIEDQGPLIVSRGIGCSTLPIRLNADPELVICTLR
jgi:uncharacterized protein